MMFCFFSDISMEQNVIVLWCGLMITLAILLGIRASYIVQFVTKKTLIYYSDLKYVA